MSKFSSHNRLHQYTSYTNSNWHSFNIDFQDVIQGTRLVKWTRYINLHLSIMLVALPVVPALKPKLRGKRHQWYS